MDSQNDKFLFYGVHVASQSLFFVSALCLFFTHYTTSSIVLLYSCHTFHTFRPSFTLYSTPVADSSPFSDIKAWGMR